MTERQRDMKDLLQAFVRNKSEPNKDNLEALFEVIERIEIDTVLVPLLELAFDAIDQYALNMGQRTEEVIASMRRVPALN